MSREPEWRNFRGHEKFKTGFSDSHLSAVVLRAKLHSDVNTLAKVLPRREGARFRYKLEVEEI